MSILLLIVSLMLPPQMYLQDIEHKKWCNTCKPCCSLWCWPAFWKWSAEVLFILDKASFRSLSFNFPNILLMIPHVFMVDMLVIPVILEHEKQKPGRNALCSQWFLEVQLQQDQLKKLRAAGGLRISTRWNRNVNSALQKPCGYLLGHQLPSTNYKHPYIISYQHFLVLGALKIHWV